MEPGRAAGAEYSSSVLPGHPALPCGLRCHGRRPGAGCQPRRGCGGSGWHCSGCSFVRGLPAQPWGPAAVGWEQGSGGPFSWSVLMHQLVGWWWRAASFYPKDTAGFPVPWLLCRELCLTGGDIRGRIPVSEHTLPYQRVTSRLSALSNLVPPCLSDVAVPAAWLGLHRPVPAQFGQLLPGSWSHWAASPCPDCTAMVELRRAPAGRGPAPQMCLQVVGETGSSAGPGSIWRPSETLSTESPRSAEAGSKSLTGGR